MLEKLYSPAIIFTFNMYRNKRKIRKRKKIYKIWKKKKYKSS